MKKIDKKNLIRILILDFKMTWIFGLIPYIYFFNIWNGGRAGVIIFIPIFAMLFLHSLASGILTTFWVFQQNISANKKIWVLFILSFLGNFIFVFLVESIRILSADIKITCFVIAILSLFFQIYFYKEKIKKMLDDMNKVILRDNFWKKNR